MTFWRDKRLENYAFDRDRRGQPHEGSLSRANCETLLKKHIFDYERRLSPALASASGRAGDAKSVEQFEAVKRWFYHDWRRIEPKLRTSIVEGISVFLSLFDDNPSVKRTFCPPKEML